MDLDYIINDYFVIIGGTDFVLSIVGFGLAFVVIMSLIDFIMD